MSSFHSFIRTVAIVAACSFVVAPIAASAEEKPKQPRVEKVDTRHHDKHDKGQFPMQPAKFDEIVERKIKHAREQMESILKTAPVADSVKAQIRKDFDAAAAKIREAAKDAGKDGKVTKDEARDVKKQARSVVKELKKKYGKDKDDDKDD